MRKLLIPIIIISFQGCASMYQTASYDIGMEQVERPTNIAERFGEVEIARQDTSEMARYVYQDSLISIGWVPTATQFYFDIENQTPYTMRIVWDDAAFVNDSGQSMRVVHSNVTYQDRFNSQPPTVVVRGGRVTDTVIPVDNISMGAYGLEIDGIFEPYQSLNPNELQAARQHIGKRVQVLLPLEIQGNLNEYIFTFVVNDVEVPNAVN